MPQRRHLLNIQRAFYERLQKYVDRFLGQLNPKIKRYLSEYQRNYARFQRVSSKQELLKEILDSHLVFCGDYHTLSQSQRTVLRLLRETVAESFRKKRPVILALEAFDAAYDPFLQDFISGKISEKALKAAVSFDERWGFSWDSYSEILRFAKSHSLRVVGINTEVKDQKRSLEKRDAFAAKVLAEHTRRWPKALVVVLIGDFHLAAGKLPRQMELSLKKSKLKRKTLVVLQNEERFYWKLAGMGLEQKVDVVKVKSNVFCVLSAPPWVKLRSQIDWALAKQVRVSSEEWGEEVDYSDEAVEFLEAIGAYFGFRKKLPNNYSLMTAEDASLATLLGSGTKTFSAREKKLLTIYLGTFESLFVPRRNVLYLNRLSLNQLAGLAARLWHAELSGFNRVFHSPKEDFYPFIWVEALGFLGSKLLNHKRKTDGPTEWKRLIATQKEEGILSDKRIVASWALHHFRNERGPKPEPHPLKVLKHEFFTLRQTLLAYRAARELGALLGNALFRAVMEGYVTKAEVKVLFSQTFGGDSAYLLYRKWIRRVDRHGLRAGDKRERL